MKNTSWQRATVFLVIAALLPLFAGCFDGGDSTGPPSHKVAVYNGDGSWSESAKATKAALEADSLTVDFVNASDVQESLDGYGLLVLTGDDPGDLLSALGSTGKLRIKSFVESGGGLIALGPACYALGDSLSYNNLTILESPVDLFSGYATGPIVELAAPGSHAMTQVSLASGGFNPIDETQLTTLYRGGPLLVVRSPANAAVVATFDQLSGIPAAISMTVSVGRVVLFVVQPEIEEGSLRDNSTWGADLVDPDSEWEWLQNAARWCLWDIY